MGLGLTSLSGLKHFFQTFFQTGLSIGYFRLSRGTKQGDPLPRYLFILILEILFIQVRNDPSVQGFKIGVIEIMLSAFADDTTYFCEKERINQQAFKYYEKIWRIFFRYMPMLKNAKLVGLGIQSVEQTSQLIVKLLPPLEVQ